MGPTPKCFDPINMSTNSCVLGMSDNRNLQLTRHSLSPCESLAHKTKSPFTLGIETFPDPFIEAM